jgi:hypothetical protein
MFFVSFAHRFLLLFGIIVLTVLTLLLADLGFLGLATQSWLHYYWDPAYAFYLQNKVDIDFAAKIVGASGTAFAGMLAVYKSWYYAEHNLPCRLQHFLEKDLAEFLTHRPPLLEALRDPVLPRNFLEPAFHSSKVHELLRSLSIGGPHTTARKLVLTLDDLHAQIGVLRNKSENVRAQIVTAHLLRGQFFAAQAARSEKADEKAQLNKSASDEFRKAVNEDDKDLMALEFAARQCVLIQDGRALEMLKKWTQVAEQSGNKICHSRALRLHAELLEKQALPESWNEARALVVSLINDVLAPLVPSTEKYVELAQAYKLLAEVQLKREKFFSASNALNHAETLFQQVGGEIAKEGQASIDDCRCRIGKARQDGEDPVPDATPDPE